MYPPKVTDSLDESISNMFASLQRACPVWSGHVTPVDQGKGETTYVFTLQDCVPANVRKDLLAFVQGYMKRCGWRTSARLTKYYLEVSVSNV